MRNIRIIESFVSWQGESNDTGKRMLILRFKRCNRNNCGFGTIGCDTQVKMRTSVEYEMSLMKIQETVDQEKCNILITGGEPTFGQNLSSTVDTINNIKCRLFNIETNGYELLNLIEKVNKNKNVKYMLSPKLFSEEDMTFYIDLANKVKDIETVHIKLVYENREDVHKFLDYLQEIDFPNNRIWLMPEGTSRESIMEHAPVVFDAAEKYKVNFSSREHIIYGFV